MSLLYETNITYSIVYFISDNIYLLVEFEICNDQRKYVDNVQ